MKVLFENWKWNYRITSFQPPFNFLCAYGASTLLFYMQYKLWTSELADSILHTVRSIIKFMCVSKTGSITLECYYWYTLPKILWVSHSVNWSSCSRCLIEASTKFRERRISQSKPSLNIGSVNRAFLFWYWQRPKKHFFRNIFF